MERQRLLTAELIARLTDERAMWPLVEEIKAALAAQAQEIAQLCTELEATRDELELTRYRETKMADTAELIARLTNKNWLWTVPGALREEAAVALAAQAKEIEWLKGDKFHAESGTDAAIMALREVEGEAHLDRKRAEAAEARVRELETENALLRASQQYEIL